MEHHLNLKLSTGLWKRNLKSYISTVANLTVWIECSKYIEQQPWIRSLWRRHSSWSMRPSGGEISWRLGYCDNFIYGIELPYILLEGTLVILWVEKKKNCLLSSLTVRMGVFFNLLLQMLAWSFCQSWFGCLVGICVHALYELFCETVHLSDVYMR